MTREFEVEGRRYRASFERAITRGQRSVVATAYDHTGRPVVRQEMNTTMAKGYLNRDTDAAAPTWDELEECALQMLEVQVDE